MVARIRVHSCIRIHITSLSLALVCHEFPYVNFTFITGIMITLLAGGMIFHAFCDDTLDGTKT